MDNIIELNREMEPAVLQSSYGRSVFFKDEIKPLTFVHFADVHAILPAWNRVVEYVNYYKDYISFALHTGDYCGGNQSQYVDMYKEGLPCERTFLNCVGNHDTVDGPGWNVMPKERAHGFLFNHTEGWDVNFLDIDHSMTYYKDFTDSKIRLIVLDLYFDRDVQILWLKKLLDEALEEGLHVITAMHELTDEIVKPADTHFHSIVDYTSIAPRVRKSVYEDTIADFKDRGGNHICNLAGHHHHDLFGHTERGVLNIAVECATPWNSWCDGRRVKGTRTYDAFNVVTADTVLGVLKLVRIGDNTDIYLRTKHTLCYDYINNKMIAT